MNTPSLAAGENPVADAGAAKHVKMLLGTGMAYEFQPETIATRAFLDGFALGAAALARADSAAPKSYPNSSEIRTSEAAAPDHIPDATKMAMRTPAKHPDTVPEVIGGYEGTDGRRYWWTGGAWIYPGQEVAIISARKQGGAA